MRFKSLKQGMRLAFLMALCLTVITPVALAEGLSAEALAQSILWTNEGAAESAAPVEAAPTAAATPAPTDAPQVVSAFRFSATPVLPENQIDPGVGYFYLKMDPGAQQTLAVEVRNEGTEPVTIGMEVTPAVTNENGLIQYSTPRGETAEIPEGLLRIPDVLSMDQNEIILEPMSSQTIEVVVAMPDEAFDGTLLGGLVFTREPDEAERTGGTGMVISSRYAYVLPVRLRETDEMVLPSFAIDAVKANAESPFGSRLLVHVRNDSAAIVKPMTLSCEVCPADSDTPVITHTNERIEMAPNTLMEYYIQQDEALEPGEYVARVSLGYQDEVYEYEHAVIVAE